MEESNDNKTQETTPKVPVFTLKTREETKVNSPPRGSQPPQQQHIPTILAGDSILSPVYVAQRHAAAEGKQQGMARLNGHLQYLALIAGPPIHNVEPPFVCQ